MEALDKYGPPVQVARVTKAFQLVDVDGDGSISPAEFELVLNNLNPEAFRGKSLDLLFKAADVDHNGRLDLEEFLNFLMTGDKRGVYMGESETDDSSSSSSSEEEGGSRPEPTPEVPPPDETRPPHITRTRSRSLKHEEPATTIDEMYELLTMREGVIGGKLRLEEFLLFLAECKRDGLGPLIAKLVPQECDTPAEAALKFEPIDLIYLYLLLNEKPDASVQNARDKLATVDKRIYEMDLHEHDERRKFIRDQGLELDSPIGVGTFRKLLELFGGIIGVDEDQILAALAWTRTCRFEMSEAMALTVMNHVFQKMGSGSRVIQEPIEQKDFARMCNALGLVDRREKKGIAYPGSVFNKILKHLPRFLLRRQKIRYYDRPGMLEKKPRKRKHSHKRIVGLTQLSILMEELFKAIPKGYAQFGSPLNLTLRLLSKAAGVADSSKEEGRRFKYA
mmetsp:Transcript_105323/g.198356  ORF Transcript_105323/g.198356 Transcript_105323/m.198356 type:complete len:450 (+) Transcript_105323:58-1407(+)